MISYLSIFYMQYDEGFAYTSFLSHPNICSSKSHNLIFVKHLGDFFFKSATGPLFFPHSNQQMSLYLETRGVICFTVSHAKSDNSGKN